MHERNARPLTHKPPGNLSPYYLANPFRWTRRERDEVEVTTVIAINKMLNRQKLQVSQRFVLTETQDKRDGAGNKSYKRSEDFQTPFGV